MCESRGGEGRGRFGRVGKEGWRDGRMEGWRPRTRKGVMAETFISLAFSFSRESFSIIAWSRSHVLVKCISNYNK